MPELRSLPFVLLVVSTTAALTFVLHHVTRLLEDNLYVRCRPIFIDYSHAFDTINHEILICKLMYVAIPPNVVKWIVSFLSGRTQVVSSDGKLSSWLPITQSSLLFKVLVLDRFFISFLLQI